MKDLVTTSTSRHVAVLLQEAVDALEVSKDNWYIDATFGAGGHSLEILKRGANVIAFDWDEETLKNINPELEAYLNTDRLIIIHENFSKLYEEVKLKKPDLIGSIAGVLFDFGTNTDQLMSSDRGFSFEGEGVLDMRMDKRLGVMAKDILALVPEKQLAQLFLIEGGEHDARAIARAIKANSAPITTTKQLSDLVLRVKRGRKGKLHPATKVFQALRIAVNSELSNIEEALPQAYRILKPLGTLVTIAFHEGEDRIAKHLMRQWGERDLGTVITKSVITPSESELNTNPRSRSAKLRIFKKK